MEMSKKLLIFSDIFACIVTIVLFVGWFMNKDVSDMTAIILGVYCWVSIAHGFYFNKAKAENVIKIKQDYGLTIDEAIQVSKDQQTTEIQY